MDWLELAEQKLARMPKEAKELREAALADLYTFACLVNPMRLYGDIHKEVFRWLQSDNKMNQLLLLPRAHMKSHCIAVWCAWWITKHPETTMLYLSATAELAEKQLYDIKNILTSKTYSRYFPNMINPEEGKREKWASSKIAVDNPKRMYEGVRDWTVATAGLTTNTTGWHADVIVADDVVVPDNAYTEGGRKMVSDGMSQITSVRNAGGFTKACGTRYHPADIYATWKKQTYFQFDEDTGEVVEELPIWNIKEHVVEEDGIFLWPREVRPDGKAFGFNRTELSRIKGEYEDKVQFYAQYYNNPNDPGSERISRDHFQYFDPRLLKQAGGDWFYNNNRLNVYAAVDFAFSLSKTSDFTAIVVVGVDSNGYVYVLDIDRFKTDKISDYFSHIKILHSKWEFKKLRAEVTVAQKILVNDLKDYIRKDGLRLSVDEFRPTAKLGTKEERIAAVLEFRYENRDVWHFRGGYTPMLEEELVLARPPHDDLKDALASAVEIAVKPKQTRHVPSLFGEQRLKTGRFGGIAFRG